MGPQTKITEIFSLLDFKNPEKVLYYTDVSWNRCFYDKKRRRKNTMKAFFVFIGPLITFPYASRILGPEGIGVVNFSNSIISYFLIFAGLGIKNYAAREVAKSKENKLLINTLRRLLKSNRLKTLLLATLKPQQLLLKNNMNSPLPYQR